MNPFVTDYFSRLISNGLEGQDRSNLGGLRLWKQTDYLSPNSQLVFYNEPLKAVLRNHNGTLYTVSRVDLNEDGTPKTTSRGKHILVDSALIYHTAHSSIQQVIDSLHEVFPECRGTLLPLSQMEAELKKAGLISEHDGESFLNTPQNTWPLNFMRLPVPIGINNCLFLPFPSGRPGSPQVWGYRSSRDMSQTVAATLQMTEDIPF